MKMRIVQCFTNYEHSSTLIISAKAVMNHALINQTKTSLGGYSFFTFQS
jgi:hypothetical protein